MRGQDEMDHTEDSDLVRRKARDTAEGRSGERHVPNDLETLSLWAADV